MYVCACTNYSGQQEVRAQREYCIRHVLEVDVSLALRPWTINSNDSFGCKQTNKVILIFRTFS